MSETKIKPNKSRNDYTPLRHLFPHLMQEGYYVSLCKRRKRKNIPPLEDPENYQDCVVCYDLYQGS